MSLCTELSHCESFDKTQGLFISHQTVMTPTLQLFLDPIDRLIDVPFSPPLHDYLTVINATQDSDQKVYPNPVSSDAVIFPCTTINCWPINSTTSRLFTTNDYKDILFCFRHFPSQSTLVPPPSFQKYLPPDGCQFFFSRGFCPGFGRSVFGLLGRSSSLVHTLPREPLSPVGVFPFPPPLRSLFSCSRASRRGCVWGRCSWVGRGRPS